jgi:hypothetical protein
VGYVEGRTIAIEYRLSEGRPERLPALAAELVRLKVDVIVTGGSAAPLAAKQATSTIPIVFAIKNDPVAEGVVVMVLNRTSTLALGYRVAERGRRRQTAPPLQPLGPGQGVLQAGVPRACRRPVAR